MLQSCLRALAVTGLALLSFTPAHAQILDPVNDFLPTYTGLRGGDLDVVSANGFFNGGSFTFTANMNAPLFTTPNASASNALYVWGVNRGAGTAGFSAIAPGVLFDSVIVVTLSPGGGVTVRSNGTTLNPATATISGNAIAVTVPISTLPSTGFALSQYTWNLWPRGTVDTLGNAIAGNPAISDFAPNNSNVLVNTVPEPSALLLTGSAGLTLLHFARRRKRTS